MYAHVRGKYLVSLMLILANISFDVIAKHNKTWCKDVSGRILIYRAEPSKLEALILGAFSACGLPFIYLGLQQKINQVPIARGRIVDGMSVLCGICFMGSGGYLLAEWYRHYNSLYKPLIIIDKYGITYEGKDKVKWKKVCGYQWKRNIFITDSGIYNQYFLEIVTDTDTLHIYGNRIAITLQKLYQLIDIAYKLYQESENKMR